MRRQGAGIKEITKVVKISEQVVGLWCQDLPKPPRRDTGTKAINPRTQRQGLHRVLMKKFRIPLKPPEPDKPHQ